MAAAWCEAPPALAPTALRGVPTGAQHPACIRADSRDPPQLGQAAAGLRWLGQTSAPRLPSCRIQWDFALEAEGSVQHGAEPG